MIVESAVLETYEEHGETAVLLPNEVLVLSPLAAFVVVEADGGVEIEELHRALVERFGAPPGDDPLLATRVVVESLVQTGVLRSASDPASEMVEP